MTDVKAGIATEALKIVSGVRRSAYGKPEQNFDRICDFWASYLHQRFGLILGLRARDVAAMMRLMKEARLIETPDHRDSFVDLVGYALCGAEVSGVKSGVKSGVNPDHYVGGPFHTAIAAPDCDCAGCEKLRAKSRSDNFATRNTFAVGPADIAQFASNAAKAEREPWSPSNDPTPKTRESDLDLADKPKFKVGDIVRAKSDSMGGDYRKGGSYEVRKVTEWGSLMTSFDEHGSKTNGWHFDNFELAVIKS